MKLWYQSMTLASAWPGYNRALRGFLDRVKDPGTQIEIHGITERGGIGDQYLYLAFIETQEVLANVARAAREGFDGFLIGNIADPGLHEAREIADIPVLGLCETSVHLASTMGANFGLVTGNEKHASRIVENIGRYGLREKLHSVRSIKMPRLLDLDEGFRDPAVRSRMVQAFLEAAGEASDEGAEVVIPSIGVLMTLLGEEGIHAANAATPILNGVTALVKSAESVVRMRNLMGGHWTSRRNQYAQPPVSQIAELRAAYGDVYPGIAEPGKEPIKRKGEAS
jgi:allantoin racemase